jgi:hypothetical protein
LGAAVLCHSENPPSIKSVTYAKRNYFSMTQMRERTLLIAKQNVVVGGTGIEPVASTV